MGQLRLRKVPEQLKVIGHIIPEPGLEPGPLTQAPAPGQNRARPAQYPNPRVTHARTPPPADATGPLRPTLLPSLQSKRLEPDPGERTRAGMRTLSPGPASRA